MQTDRVVLTTVAQPNVDRNMDAHAPRSLLVRQAAIAVAEPLTAKHQALDYLVLGQ